MAEISKWGYDSERGREALRKMNRAHSRFDISNDDYLYVLSTFIYEPIRWMERTFVPSAAASGAKSSPFGEPPRIR